MRSEQELDDIMERCLIRVEGAHIYDELRRLLSILNMRKIERILEIGSEEGGSLGVWLNMFSPIKIVNVDLNNYKHVEGKSAELEERWKSWCGKDQSIKTVWGDSHSEDTKNRVKSLLDGKVGLLFIDADHSEVGMEMDYNMYKEFVASPGLIVFHDIYPYLERENAKETGKLEVSGSKFWDRLKGPAIDMFQDRKYHKGLRPPFIEIGHDPKNQKAFGYGIIFC